MTLIKEKRWDCVANKVERKWNDDIFNDEKKKKKICWAYYLADDYIGEGKGIGFLWANKCDDDAEKDDYYCKFAKECHAELVTGPGKNWDENIIDPDTSAEKFKECDGIIYIPRITEIWLTKLRTRTKIASSVGQRLWRS